MIGSLRERIEILRPLRIPDEGGGYSFAYSSVGSVAAKSAGRRAGRDRSLELARFRLRRSFVIRHRDDIIFEMRLVHRGRTFRITDIQEQDEQGRFTRLEAEEITP